MYLLNGRTSALGACLAFAVVLISIVAAARAQAPGGANHASDSDLDKLRSALASQDAKTARRAMHALAAAPDKSIPYFNQRLKPRAAEKPERLRQLIEDLGSKNDMTRERARIELKKLGDLAAQPLQQVLAGSTASDKIRAEVEALLGAIQTAKPTGDQLRTYRAIQVLEQIGSPQSQKVLQSLATGAPEASETKEARAALEHLKMQAGATRLKQ